MKRLDADLLDEHKVVLAFRALVDFIFIPERENIEGVISDVL